MLFTLSTFVLFVRYVAAADDDVCRCRRHRRFAAASSRVTALSATLREPTWLQRVPSVPFNFQKGARRLSGAGGAGPVPNVTVRRATRPLSFRVQVKNGDGRI